MEQLFAEKGIIIQDQELFTRVLELVRERCTLLPDFVEQASFFFKAPDVLDTASVAPKWNEDKEMFFDIFSEKLMLLQHWMPAIIELLFKETALEKNLKAGELQLPFRIMLVGGKFGPTVFDIAAMIGKAETVQRIKRGLELLRSNVV